VIGSTVCLVAGLFPQSPRCRESTADRINGVANRTSAVSQKFREDIREAFPNVAVRRDNSEPTKIIIEWDPAVNKESAPMIFWGSTPDDIIHIAQPVSRSAGSVTVVDPTSSPQRPYFELQDRDGNKVKAAERQLPLKGHANFRDLGGYRAADGRRVKWGKLFRHGDLSKLTRDDVKYVSLLEFNLMVCLRTAGERKGKDTPHFDGAQQLWIPIESGAAFFPTLLAGMQRGDISDVSSEYMAALNAGFVTDFTADFAAYTQAALAADGSCVQCTAGKDRTGWAAAILLLLLGVAEEDVMEDYLLTNACSAEWAQHNLAWLKGLAAEKFGRPELDLRPAWNALRADRAYLRQALETVRREYGSFDEYARRGLGVTDEQRKAFQDSMLE
jgi:protein-tyrosine phosphatase